MPQPVIFFESTHRILKTLEALEKVANVQVSLGRELTKLHEELVVGNPSEVLSYLSANPVKQKGEFVVIVEIRG